MSDSHNVQVLVHLRSNSWETRVAASQAIQAIAKNVPSWNPPETNNTDLIAEDSDLDFLSFDTVDIDFVIRNGATLVASAGQEYDDVDLSDLDPKERIALQKKQLKERLGLAGGFMDVDFFNERDIVNTRHAKPQVSKGVMPKELTTGKSQARDLPLDADTTTLSKRELLARKRKAKAEAKTGSKRKVVATDIGASSAFKRRKQVIHTSETAKVKIKQESDDGVDSIDTSAKDNAVDKIVIAPRQQKEEEDESANFSQVFSSGDEWPFEGVCEQLFLDLFDASWEIRHGAAMGLRDIIKVSGSGAGMVIGTDKQTNHRRHMRWLEDAAIRLLCVLTLDRFADFVGELVVLPVVETASQTLGAIVQLCSAELALKIVNKGLILLADSSEMIPNGRAFSEAELLRQDLVGALLIDKSLSSESRVFRSILNGLRDQEDDVRAVSSATLLPITDILFRLLSPNVIYQSIVSSLWESLLHLDDIAAATAPVMELLARLLAEPLVIDAMEKSNVNLAILIPRLYPFFRHGSAPVRVAVLKTLSTLAHQPGDARWISIDLLRLVFQNFVLEEHAKIVDATGQVWSQLLDCLKIHKMLNLVLVPVLPTLLSIVMSPIGTPFELRLFLLPSQESNKRRLGSISDQDKAMATQDLTVARYSDIFYGRIRALQALGYSLDWLFSEAPESHEMLQQQLPAYASSGMAAHRIYSSIMIEECASRFWSRSTMRVVEKLAIAATLHHALSQHLLVADSGQQILYTEVMQLMESLWSACFAVAQAAPSGLPILPPLPNRPPPPMQSPLGAVFSIPIATEFLNQASLMLDANRKTVLQPLLATARALIASAQSMSAFIETRVLAAAAASVLQLNSLPSKVNPIVRSLMASVKTEREELLQARSGHGVACLIEACLKEARSAAIADKVLKNLVTMLSSGLDSNLLTLLDGVVSLKVIESQVTVADFKKAAKRKAVDSSATHSVSSNLINDAACVDELDGGSESIARRGAGFALEAICQIFGNRIFEALPRLWSTLNDPLLPFLQHQQTSPIDRLGKEEDFAREVYRAMNTTSILIPHLDTSLQQHVASLLPAVVQTLRSSLAKIRNIAAKCMASAAVVLPAITMRVVVDGVLPLFGEFQNVSSRQGAVECVHYLIDRLEISLLPYITFLIVPTLGRMSDQDTTVRQLASQSFARLVRLIPLEQGVPDPEGFPQDMIAQRNQERHFVAQLVGAEKVEEYQFPDGLVIKAELRTYQREGVSWLWFLNRFGLHGILCDDMGLGKTLQTICVIASDQHTRRQRFAKTHLAADEHLPNLVVCPPTLTSHWYYEIQQFTDALRPMLYTGVAVDRVKLRGQIKHYDVCITSYEVIRNDIDDLSSISWNYCVLDEGHVIRNARTKLTLAVKRLHAQHRLILSGTPIQNRVLELWSLFDFLMPGFLGSESRFNEMYSKPIQASRDAKSTSKEQEAGTLALESLHRQVLPFLLRRMKEHVLHDLPPKIIQDYYCDLSQVQRMLYDDFSNTQAGVEVAADLTDDSSDDTSKATQKGQHVFQALQYLRKLCDHPALVLTPAHPKYDQVMNHLEKDGSDIRDVKHAPKLESLRELLMECGIGVSEVTSAKDSCDSTGEDNAVAPHRALVFCQLKSMLDLIEDGLFKKLMPGVTYLRLDGGVEASRRHDIVTRFNKDPSIDVLLLTTHVGGLGLNLTGADTVVFVEHDWNPMKDLQAMDRAHRIGQKRVVNVYRLVTRGTLEEKIMGLQKFKLNIASSVVNEENVGLRSIGENDQVLDLFRVDSGGSGTANNTGAGGSHGKGKSSTKEVLENLSELWAESEYDDLDVTNFVRGLK
ncbi:hypothetical protein SeMB42_g00138 [Synchytrium endobioticum]|uniref:TATA-binding protein-associated factor mot1 n=1 Tax=Synchytrium endobioticum TaxID=286115 RepID=A0A507DUF8_9FUNG|nr:hypothetical protein SeMB42_g00138 [Synchytrium endobioticum]